MAAIKRTPYKAMPATAAPSPGGACFIDFDKDLHHVASMPLMVTGDICRRPVAEQVKVQLRRLNLSKGARLGAAGAANRDRPSQVTHSMLITALLLSGINGYYVEQLQYATIQDKDCP